MVVPEVSAAVISVHPGRASARWAQRWSEGEGGAPRPRWRGRVAGAHFQIWTAADRRAFDIWKDDRRAVAAAEMARAITGRDSLIFAGEHTGSVRYYGGRMTGYFFFMRNEWMDRAVDWLRTPGHSSLPAPRGMGDRGGPETLRGQQMVKALDRGANRHFPGARHRVPVRSSPRRRRGGRAADGVDRRGSRRLGRSARASVPVLARATA